MLRNLWRADNGGGSNSCDSPPDLAKWTHGRYRGVGPSNLLREVRRHGHALTSAVVSNMVLFGSHAVAVALKVADGYARERQEA
jgi:hypothetical protein